MGWCYVADVIGIPIIESDADVVVEEVFEVLDKLGVDKVAGICEVIVDIWRRFSGRRIVQIHANGLLNVRQVEVVDKVLRWGWIVGWMPDIISATATKLVVRPFNIGPTRFCGVEADVFPFIRGAVRGGAGGYLVFAHTRVVIGGFHIEVDAVVHGFNAVGVVDGELGVVGSLSLFVNNAVTDAEGVHDELSAVLSTVSNCIVLIFKVREEGRSIVASITFCP